MSTKVLFACSKCFSRHPFEELSAGQQLCKDCRGSYPIVKCTYCRTEFQQISRSSTSAICKRCEQNIKQHGKPSACELCNIIAAFIGNKCQRCASSEAKYGPAVACDQCKQRCAFDRRDENKKIDGKLLCWLCTCSYKRALAKARQVERDSRLSTKKRPHPEKERTKENSSTKKLHRDIAKQSSNKVEVPEKSASSRPVVNNTNTFAAAVTIDPNSSDHVVAMTTLKEQIASLQRRLNQKDKELLEKDKLITELKGKNFDKENEMRNKMKDMERLYELKVDLLNKKVASLLKEVATLSKQNTNKKNGSTVLKSEVKKEKEKKESEKEKDRDREIEIEMEKDKIDDSDKEEEKDEKIIKDEKSDKDDNEDENDRSDSEKNDKSYKEEDERKEDSTNEEQNEKNGKDEKNDNSSEDSSSRSGSPASN
ncbi:protein FAM76A [Condylostylus longicornis]|uniref:protein FAM76A n=1 Tax=Condylostylus longicornis TaxID=2530218 RepID=UPI00244E0C01|nr:protein FAM76A [Condylostylus longicornis]